MSVSPSPKSEPPPGTPAVAQWFIGRDGQQFGPVTEVEFRKLIELGHLRPTDLIWREGWPEWRPAHVLLPDAGQVPPRPQSAPPVASPQPAPPAGALRPGGQTGVREEPRQSVRAEAAGSSPARRKETPVAADDDRDAPRGGGGRWLKVIGFALFFIATLSGAIWLYQPQLQAMFGGVFKSGLGGMIGSVSAPRPSAPATAPIKGFSADAEATDRMLQTTALFSLLKRTHPDWYGARVTDAASAIKAGTGEPQVLATLMQAVVKLRRQHAENASSAPLGHLQAIGQSFVANLALLKSISPDTCFAFISNGEAAPAIAELYQNKDHTALLQRQLVAVFEAVEEGRKTPRVYPAPKQADYDILVTELQTRGWTQADIQTFSDSRALAKAPPDKVCALVSQWFESQLALKDADVRLRLLVDSLRPMIAG